MSYGKVDWMGGIFTFPSKVLSFDSTDTNLYLSDTYMQNENIKILNNHKQFID